MLITKPVQIKKSKELKIAKNATQKKKIAEEPKTSVMRKKKNQTEHDKLNPVLEVILEARFSASNWTAETPDRLHDLLVHHLRNIDAGNLVGAGEAVSAVDAMSAFNVLEQISGLPYAPLIQMWNEDRTELLQFGPNVFIATSLAYSNWSNLARIAETGIEAYLKAFGSARVEHLSFRIINQLDLSDGKNAAFAMDKFFELYVGLPKNFREVEGFQVSFQKFLKEDKKSIAQKSPIHMQVELRTASKSDLTAIASGFQNAMSSRTIFFLDVNTSCTFDDAVKSVERTESICVVGGQLHFAAMEAIRSIVRAAVLKKYQWQEL
jgi:uncharacterized protein (TIGR04255 family)